METCIHELFAEQARLRPGAVAVTGVGEPLSYAELDRRSSRLARVLRSRGVGPEARVAVLLDRSPELATAYLAVLKAGGACVPLDRSHPLERLERILGLSRARALVGREESLAGWTAQPEVALVDVREGEDEGGPLGWSWARSAACVFYTSGSTGEPKGVVVTHGSVVRLVRDTDYLQLAPGDTVLQLANPAFDASSFEIWGALLNGARLLVLPKELALSPAALAARLCEEPGPLTFFLTTALFNEVVREVPDAFAGVRDVLFGGEAVDVRRVEQALRAGGPRRLLHLYGPTESTTFATWQLLAAVPEGASTLPIGLPTAGTRAWVVDADGRPAPPDTPGELLLGGSGLARGYEDRPDLTAERFVPDPFSGESGARLYRTGDLVRQQPGGALEFAGRVDHQVKIRGFRVEPGEIEAALRRHPGVRDAVVAVRREPAGVRLGAWVVPNREPGASAARLSEHLRAVLPEFMQPAFYVLLDRLPLTSNGKVDLRALPEPRPEAREERGREPRTETERRLERICAELLGVEALGVDDDLAERGAHSLLFTRIAARIREATGVDVPLVQIFTSPTVAALAACVDAARSRGPEPEEPELVPVPRDGELPLSFAQERVWFIQQMKPDSLAYNFQATFRFRGRFQPAALAAALGEMVRRHEILRTAFPATGGRPRQEIHPPRPAALPVVDLSGLAPARRETAVDHLLVADLRRPFDLRRLPLMRWVLVRRDEADHTLFQVEHHLLHDGWSFTVFVRELLRLYRAFAAGEPSPLSEPELQFADFAVWQRRWMETGAAQRQLDHWRRKLAGSPPLLELPSDRPRPPVQTHRGDLLHVDIPAELARRLREAGRAQSVSLFVTLLTAFLALLHRYTGQEDLVVGSAIANRRRRESEGLIGMILNTVALRADLSGDPSFAETLARLRDVTLEAWEHQDLPFDRVVDALRPVRSAGFTPVYQTTFSFHDSPMADVPIPGVAVEIEEGLSNGAAKFDLNLAAIPYREQRLGREGGEEGIRVLWEYSIDLFDRATALRLAGHYLRLLGALADGDGRPLSELPLLAPQEERQLVAEWNATAVEHGAVRVHERVAAIARSAAAAPAVVRGGRVWSYGELDRRANGLAQRLRRLGVGPESRVGVCLSPSAERVLALLAVLKAGGAYVPLDPAHPEERLRFLLEDAGVAALVTETALAPRLADLAPGLPVLDAGELEAGAPPDVRLTGDNLAYVIYTSGSTGRPKGVAIRHASLANLVGWHQRVYGVTPADRATLVASAAFDASVWELWPYLTAGASLHVPEEGVRAEPAKLLQWLADSGVTLCFLPTPLAEAVLAEPMPDGLALRGLLTGGDRLHGAPRPGLGFEVWNHYGPTEGTVVATWERVPAYIPGAPPIGRPVDNAAVHVLDRHLQPAPVGVPGELCLGGAGLARGYLGRPDLTAERFVPDPFGAAGERLYRTGDLVRRRPDGRLEFLRRIDRQVKIRGFRIEPGEIETALAGHPEVREAAVATRPGPEGEPRLIAWWVPADPARPPAPLALRAFLKDRLPEPVVPSIYLALEALPLSPHGKVDRDALREPGGEEGRAEASWVEPRSRLEADIAEIWREVLAVGRVGVHDNFFDLGGHSLLLLRLHARLQERLATEIPLLELFNHPSVGALALWLSGPTASNDAVPPQGTDDRLRQRLRKMRAAAASA